MLCSIFHLYSVQTDRDDLPGALSNDTHGMAVEQ